MYFEKKIVALAVTAAVMTMAGCSSSDSTSSDSGSGSLKASYTLSNDNVYMLATGFPGTIFGDGHKVDGNAINDDNITLNIEKGTLILGGNKEALIITRGSKINAIGTAADPIVMTSRKQFDNWVAGDGTSGRGEWAGLALMGYAKSNECANPCDVEAEGGIGSYGGTNDSDSSGSLKYVVVRHAGNEITSGNELNGITLFATGSGTTMDYIQVHKGLDDGIEHFGGADFMSHIVLTDNADDSFDWGQGYTGGVQYLVAKQANDDGDRAIEADNDKGDPNATPISKPTLANMTLMAADNSAETSADGILLRRGTGANIYNTIVTGFADACLDIDEMATMAYGYKNGAYTGNLTVDNTIIDCATNFETADQDLDNADGDKDSKTGKDTFTDVNLPAVSQWFSDSGTGNVSDVTVELSSSGLPTGSFDVNVTAPSIGNAKFDNTTYAGAFDPAASSQWSEGWTVGLHGNTTVWEPAIASPVSDGTCPDGTTFVKAITLPANGGQMDLCQLKATY